MLHCALKTNDFTLFGYALLQLSSIYFSTNHHNYARWLILYALELLNIAKMLRNDGFTINRTGNLFGNVGVDMALEQTINAEAKKYRLKRIMAYADISTALNRWITINSIRSESVSQVLKIADLTLLMVHRVTPNKNNQRQR